MDLRITTSRTKMNLFLFLYTFLHFSPVTTHITRVGRGWHWLLSKLVPPSKKAFLSKWGELSMVRGWVYFFCHQFTCAELLLLLFFCKKLFLFLIFLQWLTINVPLYLLFFQMILNIRKLNFRHLLNKKLHAFWNISISQSTEFFGRWFKADSHSLV